MMANYDPFLREMLVRPSDASARLIFADYLEERGEEDTASILRQAEDMLIEPRENGGIFVGFVFSSSLNHAVRRSCGYVEVTNRLAHLALEMGL